MKRVIKPSPLLLEMVRTDFKLRYQSSLLGYLWSFLKPLLMFLVLYLVFSKFLRFGGEPLSLLLGIILWNFFSEATKMSLTSVVRKGSLIRKIDIPKYVIVLSNVLSALINLLISLVIIAVSSLFFGKGFGWSVVFLPLLIIEFILFALGVSFFLAGLFVKLRDIDYIWDLVLRMGFYLVPIIYPVTLLDKQVDNSSIVNLMLLNPVAQTIQDMRHVLTDSDAILIYNRVSWPLAFLPHLTVVTILGASIFYFRRVSPSFAENI